MLFAITFAPFGILGQAFQTLLNTLFAIRSDSMTLTRSLLIISPVPLTITKHQLAFLPLLFESSAHAEFELKVDTD